MGKTVPHREESKHESGERVVGALEEQMVNWRQGGPEIRDGGVVDESGDVKKGQSTLVLTACGRDFGFYSNV